MVNLPRPIASRQKRTSFEIGYVEKWVYPGKNYEYTQHINGPYSPYFFNHCNVNENISIKYNFV